MEETLDVKKEIEQDVLINLQNAIDEDPSLVDELPEELATESDVVDVVDEELPQEYVNDILENADVDPAPENPA